MQNEWYDDDNKKNEMTEKRYIRVNQAAGCVSLSAWSRNRLEVDLRMKVWLNLSIWWNDETKWLAESGLDGSSLYGLVVAPLSLPLWTMTWKPPWVPFSNLRWWKWGYILPDHDLFKVFPRFDSFFLTLPLCTIYTFPPFVCTSGELFDGMAQLFFLWDAMI